MSNIFDNSNYSNNSETQKKQGKKLFNKIEKYEPQNVNEILDIGCGDGYLTCMLKNKYKKSNVLGIDQSENQIESCPDVENVQFKTMEFPNKKLNNSYYDIIFSNAALHWIDEQKLVYKCIEDILDENGIACIHQGHKDCYTELKNLARTIINENYNVDISSWKYPINYHSIESLEKLVEENTCLEIEEIEVVESSLPDSIFNDYSQAGLNNFKKLLEESQREEFTQKFLTKCSENLEVEDINSKRLYFVLRK